MVKRLTDLVGALLGLALLWPLLAVAAIGVRCASPGPVLFRARRIGWRGQPFEMLKFRTMHLNDGSAARITAVADPRVFPFGDWLRRTKIDELPQLINILRGEMSVIGPRPEDPYFVQHAYPRAQRDLLRVRPGLASPGSLYHDSHGDRYLGGGGDIETLYVERLLPIKLALDLVYVERASFAYDLSLIVRTVVQICRRLVGRRQFDDPHEMRQARQRFPFLLQDGVHQSKRVPPSAPRTRVAMVVLVVAALSSCEIAAPVAHPDWLYNPSETILVGAGDIGTCNSRADDATAELLDAIPGTIFTTGDNAYPDGSAEQFAECFAPSWGRHLARIRPAPGNHDYNTPDAAGYYDYFGTRAGPTSAGYYSYRLGAWQVIALNSEIAMDSASSQLEWLRAELASANAGCVVAYWHRPRFSSGARHGSDRKSSAAWQALYAAGADVVLAGHEHFYERFAPQTPAGEADAQHGIRQFIVGTGGASSYSFGTSVANSEVRQSGTPGVLALRLLPTSYEWRWVGVGNTTFSDSGATPCHDPPESP